MAHLRIPISGSVVTENLGSQLYTDRSRCHAELGIYNSWNAFAHTSNITISSKEITYKDDGTGMHRREGMLTFLRVGRKEERPSAVTKDDVTRVIAGGKRIGKLSAARLGDVLEVTSWCKGYESMLYIDFEELAQKDVGEYGPRYSERTCRKSRHGTLLRITRLREQEQDPESLAAKLSNLLPIMEQGDEFNVYVNGMQVRPVDLGEGYRVDFENKVGVYGVVTGNLTLYDRELPEGSAGVFVRVRNNITGDGNVLNHHRIEGIHQISNRFRGEFNADFLDDVVAPGRNSFVRNTKYSAFRNYVVEQIKGLIGYYERKYPSEIWSKNIGVFENALSGIISDFKHLFSLEEVVDGMGLRVILQPSERKARASSQKPYQGVRARRKHVSKRRIPVSGRRKRFKIKAVMIVDPAVGYEGCEIHPESGEVAFNLASPMIDVNANASTIKYQLLISLSHAIALRLAETRGLSINDVRGVDKIQAELLKRLQTG